MGHRFLGIGHPGFRTVSTRAREGECELGTLATDNIVRHSRRAEITTQAQLCGDADSDLVPRLRDPNLLNAFAVLADDLRMVLKASGRGESCGQEPASNPRLR